MEIKTDFVGEMTIEEFADSHHLTMVVRERRLPVGNPSRYYASFEAAEVKGDGVLIGTYGNGSTPEEAIANYANEITLKTLVLDAMNDDRREIPVPRLTEGVTNET